jgi:hypothetical protein
MASSLKFVDSIISSPTTRLDLGDGTTFRVVRDGTEFPPPSLRRTIAQTLLQDGGIIPAAAYDFRRIVLELTVDAATADAVATALQALHRELDRPGGNLLRWQNETTHPVFFRTFRTSASAVDARPGFADGKRKRVIVDLLAEPFGYGLLETPVSGATLATNPASANGNFLDVTGVKGDVETPALIRWPASAVVANRETLFAVRRTGTPSGAPFLFQAEAMAQGTDTTTQANDAAFSGSGNNYSRCTFATFASEQNRLSFTDLGTASVDLRGRYRVFARYRKNTAGDNIVLKLRWGTSFSADTTTNDAFTTPNVATLCMADLGEIQIPRGRDPVTNFRDGVQVAVSDAFYLSLRAQRVSGSGTLDVDYLILVPSDDRLGIVKWAEAGPDRWWLDAYDESVHARNSSDQIATGTPPAGPTFGLPMLTPNQTNRVFMVYEVGSGLTTTFTTVAVTISYFPLYLSVRPAST